MDGERVTTHWEFLDPLWFQEAETKIRFKYKQIIKKKLLSKPKPETWESNAEPITLNELLFPLTNIN